MKLIDADCLLEKVMAIGKQPMPDIRTKKDLEQAVTNIYHAILNEITNAPATNQPQSEKDALELAARICDGYELANKNYAEEIAVKIRTLIGKS